MSKSYKPVSESVKVADKLRDSLNMEENKPDTVNPLLGSPVTSLQTQSSGLTSAATTTTTTSCSSSSSGSFLGSAGKPPVIRRHSSGLPIPPSAKSLKSSPTSAAKSGSSNQAGAQLKSSTTSASQSSKSKAPSAAQSSKSTAPSAAQSSKSTAPSAVPSGSAAQTSKSSIPSTSQSKPRSPSDAKSSKANTPPAAKSSKATAPSAAKSGSTSKAGGKTGSSSSNPKTGTGKVNAGRSSAQSNSASGTAKTSGKSTMAPPKPIKIIPAGNLFPSGIVKITGMTQAKTKTTVLGSGTQSYGYGNIVWPGKRLSPSKASTSESASCSHVTPDADTLLKKMMTSTDPEQVKSNGNEMFKKGSFNEALKLYDRAIQLSPENAIYHSNRAAALSHLNQIGEAVMACEEAIKLDPKSVKAHRCLASLLLRLGQIDNAGMHFFCVDDDPSDSTTEKKLQIVFNHLNKCTDARRRCDWNIVLDAASAAMVDGADSSPQLALCQVEALLKLVQLEDAQTVYSFVPIIEPFPDTFSQTLFFDMTCEAYKSFVKSQFELALGRFENAVTAAEKASDLDPRNSEIKTWYKSVRLITRARDRGNDLYESDRYTEASLAYTEGLRFDPHNAALFCHRADCSFKIGKFETAIEDYSRSLISLPSYVKSRLQRAASFGKVGKWAEAVSDYETLKLEMPSDRELAESLFQAQAELRKSEGIQDMEFSGVVKEITTLFELKTALTQPGVIVLHFFRESDEQSKEMSGFMDALCICYPTLHFFKVEIDKYPLVGESERVNVVPTFKIYKHGIQLEEIVCPSKSALENSIRQYSR